MLPSKYSKEEKKLHYTAVFTRESLVWDEIMINLVDFLL